MTTRVKICGLRTAADVHAAVAAGADAVGFVLAPSVRQLSYDAATSLARLVPHGVLRVAVFRTLSEQQAIDLAQAQCFDAIQCDAADGDRIELTVGCRRLLIIRVVRDGPGLAQELGKTPADSTWTLESPWPTTHIEGTHPGVGMTPNWSRVAAASRGKRIVLAGGLSPKSVASAIRTVRPYAVDVSSGVETSPGVKSPALINEFVAAVKAPSEGAS